MRCDAALELDESLAVGMDLVDTLIARGQRRRIYDKEAARYDGSSVWLALSNLLFDKLHTSVNFDCVFHTISPSLKILDTMKSKVL